MDTIISLLFFLSIICLVVGLISPNKFTKILGNKTVTRKLIIQIFGTAIVVLFFSIGIFAPPKQDEQKVETKTEKPLPLKEGPSSQNILEVPFHSEIVTTTVEDFVLSTSTTNEVVPVEAEKEISSPILEPTSINSTESDNSKLYLVSKVVDGDTFDVNIDGQIKRVRLIGVDTPETVDPRKPVQCFGKEASSKAVELLLNKKVKLESDPTQGETDKYGRLLRYAIREDGLFFNKWMIENGYAHEYTYNKPYKYQTEFKQAQITAQEGKKGLWADNACPTSSVTTTDVKSDPVPIVTSPIVQPTQGCVIKGNINTKGEKIYHLPSCPSYNMTKIEESQGEKWFCSESEAVQAGWNKANNC